MKLAQAAAISLLAAGIVTCNQGTEVTGAPGASTGVALVALDLEAVGRTLAEDGQVPAEVAIAVDGEVAGTVSLPAPNGLLAGHAAVAVAPGPHRIEVDVVASNGVTFKGPALEIEVAEGEVAVVPAALTRATVQLEAVVARRALPDDSQVEVRFDDAGRAPSLLSDLGAPAAEVLGAILADPAVASVTPFTTRPSAADEVGPLIGVSRPAVAPAVEPAVAAVAPTVAPVEADGQPVAPEVTEAAASADDFVYYYSYCSCGEPVTHRAFTATLPGGDVVSGETDRYGFVLIEGARGAAIDFGTGQRARTRSYEFNPQRADTHPALLAALGSAIVNDQLTALLDLRREPLADAREILVALLDHDSRITWMNAAVTLSFYAGVGDVLADRLERLDVHLRAGDVAAVEREVLTIGALRQPAAITRLQPLLRSGDATIRDAARWALDFIGGS